MEHFDSLVDAIEDYRQQGYVEDFNLRQNCLECRGGHHEIFPSQFNIDKYYRFEQDTDPDNESVIYAISSEKYSLKGIFIASYGMYSEPIADAMLLKFRQQ